MIFSSITAVFSQVDFIYQDLEKAKEEARVEGRYILVDVYADWCGWCKKMDKTTFHDAKVAEFVNENMIALKINSDKGIGREIAQKYGVTGLPTIIYLDYRGNIVAKKPGYKTASQLIKDVEPYRLDKKKIVKSSSSSLQFQNYIESRDFFFQSLKEEVLNLKNPLSASYKLGEDKKAFEFDQLKANHAIAETEVAKMDVFYLLGQNKLEEALNKISTEKLLNDFSLEQTHFLVLTAMKGASYSVDLLRMINEHSVKTKDLELLSTKAAMQYSIGDVSDAKETISKAKKIAKRQKLTLLKSLELLEAII